MNLPFPIQLPDGDGILQSWTHWDGVVNLNHQLQPDGTSIDTGLSNLLLVRFEDGKLLRTPFPVSLFFSLNDHSSDIVKQEGAIIMEAIVRLHQYQFSEMGLNKFGEISP
jgi:hypothetical protein